MPPNFVPFVNVLGLIPCFLQTLRRLQAPLLLVKDADDLFFSEMRFAHVRLLDDGHS